MLTAMDGSPALPADPDAPVRIRVLLADDHSPDLASRTQGAPWAIDHR
jgi:hypothetical protein